MSDKSTKWLVYTVLVGLIPIFARLLVWGVTNSNVIEVFSSSDFIAFGLVLHISNINEIEHIATNESWKTRQNGISITFIALYSVLFSVVILSDGIPNIVNIESIKYSSMFLSVVSFIISASVYYRLSNTVRLYEANV